MRVQRLVQDHAFLMGCTQGYYYFLLFFSPLPAIKVPVDEELVPGC